MGQSYHVARGRASALKLTYGNWALGGVGANNTNSNAESVHTLGANNLRVTASIGPTQSGPWTQVTWGGGAFVSIAPLADAISDWANYNLNPGDVFFVRTYMECAGGLFTVSNYQNFSLGDKCVAGTNIGDLTDLTLSGSVGGSQAGFHICPGEILAMMVEPSVGVIGDSRAHYQADTIDSAGDLGEICRSIGPYFGYQNLSKRSRSPAQWNASHSLQVARLAHVSHIINQLGVNGMLNEGKTAAQTQTELLALYASLPAGKKVFQSTITPRSTGAWTAADGSDQTAGLQPQLSQVNDWIRANTAGITGYFEVADAVESARNSGKWKAPGYTGDGLHAVQAGMLAIKNSGAIDPARIRR
jgi:hypothetical protein